MWCGCDLPKSCFTRNAAEEWKTNYGKVSQPHVKIAHKKKKHMLTLLLMHLSLTTPTPTHPGGSSAYRVYLVFFILVYTRFAPCWTQEEEEEEVAVTTRAPTDRHIDTHGRVPGQTLPSFPHWWFLSLYGVISRSGPRDKWPLQCFTRLPASTNGLTSDWEV